MKSQKINKDDVHFRNRITSENLVVSVEKEIDEEQSRFWVERGEMNIEVTDNYQDLYYKKWSR